MYPGSIVKEEKYVIDSSLYHSDYRMDCYLTWVCHGIHFYCLNFIGIQNIGLCIIIFTIIVRLLMLPLTIKQQKFAKISQVMQPEINKIQRKYRNKTDTGFYDEAE